MAQLRHSTAAHASNSPAKRDFDASASSSPFLGSPSARGSRSGGGEDEGDGKDAHRSSPLLPHHHHQKRIHMLASPFRSLLALKDPRSPAASSSYWILLAASHSREERAGRLGREKSGERGGREERRREEGEGLRVFLFRRSFYLRGHWFRDHFTEV
ncbi:unnamed protein product [Urochloa humidicola]